jgi:signal transduction histidine kinase
MTRLLSFRWRIRSGYVLSFLLLLLSYCLIFYVQQKMVKESEWVIHTYAVLNTAESLQSGLTDAETGVRGYIITQDTRFLKPYNGASKEIPVLYNQLKSLVADNNEQQKKLDTLDQLIKKRLSILSTVLTMFQGNGFKVSDEMKLRQQSGLTIMDSLRLYIYKVKGVEEKLMQTRKKRLEDLFSGAKMMAIISLAIIFVALLYSIITYIGENKARETADKKADEYRVDLERKQEELKAKNIELKELKDMEKFTSTGRIARTIAHEVRNPLTNILLATEQLGEMENKNEESPVLLELINRNAARINQLVSDLLDATRFTHLDFSKADVNQILEEALEMAKDRIELNHITVVKNYSANVCGIFVDKEKIKLALLNIVVNAVEAMEKEKGVLEVKTRKEGNKCIIEIRDNGKGMDEEVLQKLFEPYFTSKPKGNGLGLTNTQNIILNHNGKISVYSKPGNGALFLIALDLHDSAIQRG